MPLTPRQELFCRKIASGLRQSDAYRVAYTTENMKDDTVNNNAYMLMQKSEIKERIEELNDEFAKLAMYDKKQALRDLQKAYSVAEDKSNSSAMTKSVEAINKLLGLNEEKAENKVVVKILKNAE